MRLHSPFLFAEYSAHCSLFRLLSDIGQYASVYIKYVAVYGIRSLGGQEYCGATQFGRVEPAACRSFCADETVERMAATVGLLFAQWSSLWRSDIARTYAVTLDVVFSVF